MIYRAHVEGGNIVPDQPLELADGTRVEIRVVRSAEEIRKSRLRMMKYIGMIKDLPPDASTTIDQTLYGSDRP
jgi:hypothetical protein